MTTSAPNADTVRSSDADAGQQRDWIDHLPGVLRLLLYWWWVAVGFALTTYVGNGLPILFQQGWPEFLTYLRSWALLAPIVAAYPIPFFVCLGIGVALAPIGLAIKVYEDTRRRHLEVVHEIQPVRNELDKLSIAVGPPFQKDVARKVYLDDLQATYDAVTLPVGPAESRIALDAVFQPLKLWKDPLVIEDLAREARRRLLGEMENDTDRPAATAQQGQGESESDEASEEHEQEIAEDGWDALKRSKHPRMVVLGGPGAGKTTVLKDLLQRKVQEAQADAGAPLPIFVSLPNLARVQADAQEMSLEGYLSYVVAGTRADRRFAGVLHDELIRGNVFVCLDGLDEVAPALRQGVIDMLNRDALRYGGAWIIGSRFTEYKGGQFRRGEFSEWEIQPLDDALRLQLAQRLIRALHEVLASAPAGADPGEEATKFVDAVKRHTQAAAWGENPLLFSLASVVFVQRGTLPSSRAMLYQQVLEAVVATRERDQTWRIVLLRVLGELALWLYAQAKGRTFTDDDLVTFLMDVQRLPAVEVVEVATRMRTSGVLDVVARETYGFRHQTFQEYMAAATLALHMLSPDAETREGAWKIAWSKRTYSRWTEVLRLLVGTLAQARGANAAEATSRWILALAGGENSSHEPDIGDLGLELALKSLAEVPEAALPKLGASASDNLGKRLIATWTDELLEAIRTQRNLRRDRLQLLASDVRTLPVSLVEQGIQGLVDALGDADDWVRLNAANVLGNMGDRAPVGQLTAKLRDPLDLVRLWAARALSRLGERAPVEALVEALNASSGWQYASSRSAIVRALGTIEARSALDALTKALGDPNDDVVASAAWALGQMADIAPRDALVEVAGHGNSQVRAEVIRTLGKLGERAPILTIFHAATDPQLEVREAAVASMQALLAGGTLDNLTGEALEEGIVEEQDLALLEAVSDRTGEGLLPTPEQLTQGVESDNFLVRITVFGLVTMLILGADEGQYDDPQVIALAKIAVASRDPLMRMNGVGLLGRLKERAPLESILAALTDEHPGVRMVALAALFQRGESSPIEPVVAALGDSERQVVIAALNILSAWPDRAPAEQIVAALQNGDPLVRQNVCWTLLAVRDRVPVGAWLRALRDIDGDVRAAAARALAQMGDQAPLDDLALAYANGDGSLRMQAVAALALLGSQAPFEPLARTLHDASASVQAAALLALAEVATTSPVQPEALMPLLGDDSRQLRRALLDYVERLGAHAPIAATVEVLREGNDEARTGAALALGRLSQFAPVEPLVAAVNDSVGKVRATAAWALGRFAERAPVEPLVRLLDDTDVGVQRASARALRAAGTTQALAALAEALDHEDQNVRLEAQQAIEEHLDRVPLDSLMRLLSAGTDVGRTGAVALLKKAAERVPIDPLVGLLRDERESVRRAAAAILAEARVRVPMPAWLDALADTDGETRALAAAALGDYGDGMPLEPLLRRLQTDPTVAVRAAAAASLGRLGDWAPVEALVAALGDASWAVRLAAITALGERAPLDPLLVALGDVAMEVRAAAAETLGRLGPRVAGERVVEALAAAMDTTTVDLRAAPERFAAMIGDGDAPPATAGTLQLVPVAGGGGGVRLVRPFRTLTLDEPYQGYGTFNLFPNGRSFQPNPAALVAMVGALGRLWLHADGDVIVAMLTQALESDFSAVRAKAAESLGGLGASMPVEALVNTLRHSTTSPAADAALAAATALSTLGERAPIRDMMEALIADRPEDGSTMAFDRTVRQVMECLGGLLPGDTLDTLVEALARTVAEHGPDYLPLFVAALDPLRGHASDKILVAALEPVLHIGEPAVRGSAARLLGNLPTDSAVNVLLGALDDGDASVRAQVVGAIHTHGGRVPADVLRSALDDASLEVRKAALGALAGEEARPLDPVALEGLARNLGERDASVRKLAVEAIAKHASSEYADRLLGALGDTDYGVREAALTALKALGGAEIGAGLAGEATDILMMRGAGDVLGAPVHDFIAQVVGNMDRTTPQMLKRVARFLDHHYWEVRMDAAVALGKGRRNITDAAIRRLLALRNDDDSRAVRDAADDALAEILSLETGIEDD